MHVRCLLLEVIILCAMTVGGMAFVHYSEVRGVLLSEVGNVWSVCCCWQGARSFSVGGRFSARWSVHYQRFHCITFTDSSLMHKSKFLVSTLGREVIRNLFRMFVLQC